MRNITIVLAVAFALSACARATTDQIGSAITGEKVSNPAGQNSFSAEFDPSNPGVPLSVRVAQGKDEENVKLNISYRYPDGTEVVWAYQVEKSHGNEQTAAIVAAQQAIAAVEAETQQKLGPEIVGAITSSVQAALGLPPVGAQ